MTTNQMLDSDSRKAVASTCLAYCVESPLAFVGRDGGLFTYLESLVFVVASDRYILHS